MNQVNQVYFSFAAKDKVTALPIINAVERAGFSVRHPNTDLAGEFSQRINDEIEAAKCVVALWSSAAAQSIWVQEEIQHALRAWSSNRLVLAVIDDAQLPLGLRDLPAISLKGTAEIGMKELIDQVRTVTARGTAAEAPSRVEPYREVLPYREVPSPHYASAKPRWPSRLMILAAVASIVLAAVGLFNYSFNYSAPRAPPAPVPGLGSGPAQPSPPLLIPYILIALAVGLAIGALTVWGWTVWSRRRLVSNVSLDAPPKHSPQVMGDAAQVFVSYSRQDGQTVDQLVEQIKQLGYTVWIDRQSTGSQRYAAPIVRAIRSSRLVALMCSTHSFTSDHVIREIYVAGDEKKPFIAFLLDPTKFPDEVLYFVSGFPRISIAAVDREQLRSEIARLIVSDDRRDLGDASKTS